MWLPHTKTIGVVCNSKLHPIILWHVISVKLNIVTLFIANNQGGNSTKHEVANDFFPKG